MSDTNFRSNVKNITNDRKSRILLLGASAVVIGGFVFAVAPGMVKGPGSTLPPAPTSGGAPGGTQNSPEMQQALREADRQRGIEAAQRGGTALPTPQVNSINDRQNSLFNNRDEKGASEPPEPPHPVAAPPVLTLPPSEPPRPPERPQQQAVQQPQGPQQPPGPPPLDQGLIQAMQAQMRAMLNVPIKPSETVYMYRPGGNGTTVGTDVGGAATPLASNSLGGTGGTGRTGGGGAPATEATAPVAAQQSYSRPSRFSPPAAGTILYSRLIGRVNSDVPGPVIAEITQGPLSGARLLGSFQFTEEGVIIQFSSMTVPFTDDGLERTEVVPIRAVAVDPANLGTAMSTSIDRRILERIAFGFATAFIQGLGQAITQSGSTTTLSNAGITTSLPVLNTRDQLLSAGGSAAGVAGRILDQTYGRRRTTIVVEADTPFGLLFLGNSSVTVNQGQ